MSVTSKLTQLLADFTQAREEYMKKSQLAFKEALTEFFDKNPEVKVITWSQYSPYFNDGDECTFSVHEVEFANFVPESIAYSLDEGDAPEDHEGDAWTYPSYRDSRSIPDADAVGSFINGSEDLMEEMFGNHVRVVVTRDGIDVLDIEHD